MKFHVGESGQVYTTCEKSGANIEKVYQIPKPNSTEKTGCYADQSCAVAHIIEKISNKKLDANKGKELLSEIAKQLRLAEKKEVLVPAGTIDPVNPDFSYRKKHPWMFDPDLLVSAEYLKKLADEAKKPSDGSTSTNEDGTKSKEKNIFFYRIDPDVSENSEVNYTIAKKNQVLEIDVEDADKLSVVLTTYKSKEVALYGFTGIHNSHLSVNNHVKTMFKDTIVETFYGPIFLTSRKALNQSSDAENEQLITLFPDQKKNRFTKNLKNAATDKIVTELLGSFNIITNDAETKSEPASVIVKPEEPKGSKKRLSTSPATSNKRR